MTTQSQVRRKEELLAALAAARREILTAVSALSETAQDRVFLGSWSVKDLLAHLIGWDETNLQAARSVLKGKVPAFYQYRDRDWQSYNAILVKKHKRGSVRELLASAEASQARLIAFLQSVPPEDFGKDFGVRFRGYKVTVQRLLEAEAGDERIHCQQITGFFKE